MIRWNWPNWVTIVLMAAVAYTLLLAVTSLFASSESAAAPALTGDESE